MKNQKKLLYILNIAKRVNSFSYASMIAAQRLGYEFHIAGNWSYESDSERLADEERYGIKIHEIDFVRTPYHPGNFKAYHQLKALVEKERYDAIHCNTPIGGVIGRIVGKKFKVPKVIYQAHGFHFFKGSSKKNWLLYYPIEKWLARYTDAVVTINHEDYKLAKRKLRLRNDGAVYYVPGVGIDLSNYNADIEARKQKRDELGLSLNDIALISMGDLNENKNNKVVIEALSLLNNVKVNYFLCGVGEAEETLKSYAMQLGVDKQVRFLGFRKDVKSLLQAADIFVISSKREGLPRSMMEAMASGLPCIASRIRGNTDLLEDTDSDLLCDATNASAFAEKIKFLAENPDVRSAVGAINLENVQKFSTETVIEELIKIYEAEL